jgi:hypothetical protein
MNRKSLIVTAVFAGVWLIGGHRALAQASPEPPAFLSTAPPSGLSLGDEDLTLFRKDVRSLRKQIIASNMSFTDTEAQQFWPIFDQYTSELVTISDRKYALLKEYGENYATMTSDQAENYVKGRSSVEESIVQLRLKYFPIFRKVLSGKSTALFFQIDWRLSLIMDLQLASQTPLVEP